LSNYDLQKLSIILIRSVLKLKAALAKDLASSRLELKARSSQRTPKLRKPVFVHSLFVSIKMKPSLLSLHKIRLLQDERASDFS